MKIKSLTYKQHEGKPQAWHLNDFQVHPDINLIVGKNASGKTRMINVIWILADLLSGRCKRLFDSGNWELTLKSEDSGMEIQYLLSMENNQIESEKFIKESKVFLQRESSGKGRIWAQEVGKDIAFQIDPCDLAALKKRDDIQHPFLNDLYLWAQSLRTYFFATDFNPKSIAIEIPNIETNNFLSSRNERGIEILPVLFGEGSKKWGDSFFNEIQSDMEFIGYKLDSMSLETVATNPPVFSHQKTPKGIHIKMPYCIYIKEQDLPSKITQIEISQGMFRALALLAHLNYIKLCGSPGNCILIDDIGEGLDYERSCKLIQLLTEKFRLPAFQFIMTSNDRFIMNNVPLEYWHLIERLPGEAKIYNKRNSPEIFQEFEFTGLNNFDFLASEYYKGG